MVKRQKEKQYLSSREQKAQGRSRSGASNLQDKGVVQKSLPFQCCALTLVPFESPACTIYESKTEDSKTNRYGIVFDNAALTEFVWKHKKDPVSGNPLQSSKIIQLNMDKDSQTGQWQCPVLTKAFSDHNTKIVAVLSPSGGNEANVYSYEAYHELNVKPKSYIDLTTGLKFHPKKDVLILNDPANQDFQKRVRDVSNFWHIKNARTNTGSKQSSSNNTNIRKSVTATRVMEEIQKTKRLKEEEERAKKAKAAAAAAASTAITDESAFSFEVPGSNLPFVVPTEDVTGVKYTSGSAALGLTSTSSANSSSTNDSRAATPDEILERRFRLMKSWKGKKGYVNLVLEIKRGNRTPSLTVPLLLELHCDIVPRTCTNFLGLCAKKKYDGSIFHRLIDDFMIQGGGEKLKQQTTSSTTKLKDSCLWGPDGFSDEFDDRLTHTEGGGILAMANAGPNTNKQQFYITLGRACPHLDRKHNVFGTVAKGMDVFQKALAQVTTDSKDRPVLEELNTSSGETTVTNAVVVIVAAEVLEDPSREAKEAEDKRLTELHELREAKKNKRKRLIDGNKVGDDTNAKKKSTTLGVGKYLAKTAAVTSKVNDEPVVANTNTGALDLGIPSNFGLPEIAPPVKKKAKKKKTKFGDFSSW